jgi:hypothetical protein
MVTVLITSFLLLVVISFAIYRWQRSVSGDISDHSLPPSQDFEGLFAESIAKEQARLDAAQVEQERYDKRVELLARAGKGDKSALLDAQQTGDAKLYEEILNALVQSAENEKQVLSLASFISRNEKLSVNIELAKAFIETWKSSPDRQTTAKMLHVVALAGDAALYHQAIELALERWREQTLIDVNANELITLFESEFWLIPSDARNSGAGFLLKRELAKIRREIVATIKGDK